MDQTQGIIVRPPSAAIHRDEFGARQSHALAETSSSAVAAQARAAIESRYIMALQRPRDMDSVRVRLLKECRRPSFAEVARYRKPVGKGIEGLSIRFVEAAFRALGNILPESVVIYEDDSKRIARVQVTDLEINLTYTRDIVVDKTIERRSIKDGQTALGRRINSSGEPVYIVAATDDELANKQAALESKAIRALGLRLVPGDLQDECEAAIIATKAASVKADPDAERRKLVDGFAQLGIDPRHLVEYLGHALDITTPAELLELRDVWVALRDGEATWPETLAHKLAAGDSGDKRTAPASSEPQRGNAGAKARLAARRKPDPAPAPPSAQPVEKQQADETAPDEPDDFAREVRDIVAGFEISLAQPHRIPALAERLRRLPPGPDRTMLENLLARTERAIADDRAQDQPPI
jgi:hypothetical protein